MFDVDARLARFAADHLGILARDECTALGMSLRGVDRRIEAGILEVVHDGVYRHAAVPPCFEGDLLAAVKACGNGAAASGPSAMRLFGTRGEWDDVPEVTIIGSEHRQLRGATVRRIDRLARGDVRRRFGIPVLAPPLALLLLGASAPPHKVSAAVHDMVFQQFTTRTKLIDCLDAYGGRGRRGTVAFRTAINSLDDEGRGTQTNLELDLLRLIRLHGLPEPRLQYVVVDADGARRHLDLAYPAEQVDLEADGDRWHLSLADRAADRRRDAALEAIGWTIDRFDSPAIHVRPGATVARIQRSLASRRRLASPSCQRT